MSNQLKYERAFALHQKGKSNEEIATAIDSSRNSVDGLLWYAKHRRHLGNDANRPPAAGSPAWWRARGY